MITQKQASRATTVASAIALRQPRDQKSQRRAGVGVSDRKVPPSQKPGENYSRK